MHIIEVLVRIFFFFSEILKELFYVFGATENRKMGKNKMQGSSSSDSTSSSSSDLSSSSSSGNCTGRYKIPRKIIRKIIILKKNHTSKSE